MIDHSECLKCISSGTNLKWARIITASAACYGDNNLELQVKVLFFMIVCYNKWILEQLNYKTTSKTEYHIFSKEKNFPHFIARLLRPHLLSLYHIGPSINESECGSCITFFVQNYMYSPPISARISIC